MALGIYQSILEGLGCGRLVMNWAKRDWSAYGPLKELLLNIHHQTIIPRSHWSWEWH